MIALVLWGCSAPSTAHHRPDLHTGTTDPDGDGVADDTDCDDTDPATFPGAPEDGASELVIGTYDAEVAGVRGAGEVCVVRGPLAH